MVIRLFLVAGLGGLASLGCALPQREVKISSHQLDQPIAAFSTPADLRLTFVRDGKTSAIFCAEPMPDVAMGSNVELSGSGKGSRAAEASLSSSYSSTLKDLNEAIEKENTALRRELDKALADYKKETGHEYKTSVESALEMSRTSAAKSSASLELQAAAKFAATTSELQGRTQQVLLAREFLYRLCEARANGFFTDNEKYVNMQENALRMVEAISKPSQKTQNETKAELLKQANDLQKSQVGLCKDIEASCKSLAAKAADEIKKCTEALQTCLVKAQTQTDTALKSPTKEEGSSALVPSAKIQ